MKEGNSNQRNVSQQIHEMHTRKSINSRTIQQQQSLNCIFVLLKIKNHQFWIQTRRCAGKGYQRLYNPNKKQTSQIKNNISWFSLLRWWQKSQLSPTRQWEWPRRTPLYQRLYNPNKKYRHHISKTTDRDFPFCDGGRNRDKAQHDSGSSHDERPCGCDNNLQRRTTPRQHSE